MKRVRFFLLNIYYFFFAVLLPHVVQSQDVKNRQTIILSCAEDNDLYVTLKENKVACIRYQTPGEAIDNAVEGSAALILADNYPARTTTITASLFEKARIKKIKLYVEYPGLIPGIDVGEPIDARMERVVVSSDFFNQELNESRILSINSLRFIPVTPGKTLLKNHLIAAKIAGFDSAVFGLPEKAWPLLFEYQSGGKVLISTTKLSSFISGRSAPVEDWKVVWGKILQWLYPKESLPRLNWTPMVGPTRSYAEILPRDVEKQSLKKGLEWFISSKLLAPKSRELYEERVPTPLPCAPVGDGSSGILEAQLSIIQPDGSQMQSAAKRGDCTGESAMALAFGGVVFKNKDYRSIARNLLDFYYFTSDAAKNERGDPTNGAYGLIAWGISSEAWYKANYGDDNARLLLGTIATAALLKDDRWEEATMRCLLANLRTTGRLGFRGDRIDLPELTKNGWEYYFQRDVISYSGNFEAYLWACYLWAYQQTGYQLFYDRAENGIRMMMAEYTDGWRWGSSISQEKARMLLPLAWLVRVKDTPEHRKWLHKAVDGLLALQESCGAIREELGTPGKGMFPPTNSNESYGKSEAPLFQQNGDPVCDLLYTMNFAFLGLHEAAAATGDSHIREAEEKMAKFLCRIQIKSPAQPSLDGGWFRAFDFKRWEAWGSNADAGWGAWVIETGWSQSWITAVLAMRQMGTSFWALTKNSSIDKNFEQIRKEMIPDEIIHNMERNPITNK